MANPFPNPNKTKVILWRSVLGGLLILAGVIWAAQNDGQASGCVIDSKSLVAKPPTVAHHYDSETIAYYRNDNRFTPVNDSKILNRDGKNYELHLEFEQKLVSPIFGSAISGSIRVTENGRTLRKLPTEKNGQPILPTSVGINLVGVNQVAKAPINLERTGASVTSVPITKQKLPFPITHLYSDAATDKNELDLSKGRADFTLIYFGHREMPYIEVVAGIDRLSDRHPTSDVWFASKAICFQDQTQPTEKPAELEHISKGEFYYELTATPDRLVGNQTKQIRLDVVARNSSSKRIIESPFQRVRVWAYPVNNVAWGESEPGQVEGGEFISSATDAKLGGEIADYSLRELKITRAPQYRVKEGVELDLINGRGRAYFNYSGAYGDTGAPSQLAFVVQPSNYYSTELTQGNETQTSYRKKQQIKYPDQRSGLSGKTFIPESINPIAADRNGKQNNYLYISWRDDDSLRNEVFTITSLPIATARSVDNSRSNTLIYLGIGLLVAGGAWLFLRRKRSQHAGSGSKTS